MRRALLMVLALGLVLAAQTGPKPEMVVQLGHTSRVNSVAISPDGRFAFTAGGNAVILWDLATGAELRTFGAHGSGISAFALSGDGKTLACGNYLGALWLVDLEHGVEVPAKAGHKGTVCALAFSADGKTLASGGADDTVRLWNVATG